MEKDSSIKVANDYQMNIKFWLSIDYITRRKPVKNINYFVRKYNFLRILIVNDAKINIVLDNINIFSG